MKRGILLCVSIGAFALASCVGIDSQATIAQDGSVEAQMVYTVPNAADELGKLGSNAAQMPVPVGRDDLELAATRAGGTLSSWSRKDGDDAFTVSAKFAFPDPGSYARFIDPLGEMATFTSAGGRSTLTITLSKGQVPADPDLAAFLKLAFGDRDILVKLTLPRQPSAVTGFTAQGRIASFSAKAVDLYASKTPVTISVTW